MLRLAAFVAVVGCGRIGFAPVVTAVDPADDASGDSTSGSDPCGSNVVLADLFTTSTVQPVWSTAATPDVTMTQGGGDVTISFGNVVAEEGGSYTTTSMLNLADACATLEVLGVPDATTPVLTHLEIGMGTVNVRMEILDGELRSIHQSGNLDDHLDIRAFDPVAHRFLRIRNVGTSSWFFEASPDDISFTTLASMPTSAVPTTAVLQISATATLAYSSGGATTFGEILVTR